MNPFEQHGIGHLSASSINLYAAEPAMWVLQYLFGHKSQFGIASTAGQAIEDGVEKGLFDLTATVEECTALALRNFDRRTALSRTPNQAKWRAVVEGAVPAGLNELRQYGVPCKPEKGRQHEIKVKIDGVPVPFLGKLDFDFPQHGIIVDLKASQKLASRIANNHARQGAIYKCARGNNVEMRFAYVTNAKIGVYIVEDYEKSLAEVVNIANRIEKFLSLSNDKHELASFVAPNTESFYWSDQNTIAVRKEIYGY